MAASSYSALFNADWYLLQNPDVADAVVRGLITAEAHFQEFGNAEGRAPGPLFDPQYYLAANPDVAAAVAAGLISAYDHFARFGAAEGRSPLALFDPEFYLAQNPDVAAAVAGGLMSATEHFLMFGQVEPRQINPFINLADYLSANADLAEAYAQGGFSPFAHLLTHGVAEGRNLGNGISLGVFAGDPKFQVAIESGNFQHALERVQEVAAFLPGFQPPAGWQAPADTPIPTDFTPPPGIKLVVPPSVVVPPDSKLPDTFVPVTPPVPTPPPPAPAGDGDSAPPESFKVKVENGVVTFPDVSGDISFVVVDTTATFKHGGVWAATTVDLTTVDQITLAVGQTLVAGAAQITGLTINGEGGVWMAGGNGFPKTSLNNANAVFNEDMARWIAGHSNDPGPVTMDIGTSTKGPGNLLIATRNDDHINVSGDARNMILPGHGKDTVVLDGTAGHFIIIEAGVAKQYVGTATFDMSLSAEGQVIFVYIGYPNNPSLGEALRSEYRNGEWGEFRNDLGKPVTGISLNSNTGEVTVARDNPFLFYAHEQGGPGGSGSGTITKSPALTDVPRLSAGSHPRAMDEIYGFSPQTDTIFSAHLYHGGHGASAASAADAQFTTDFAVNIAIKNGIATILNGSLPTPDALEYVLEQLSLQMNVERRIVGYEHEGSTYLLHGDGEPGLSESDMVVKLVDVTGITDLADITTFKPPLLAVTLDGTAGNQTVVIEGTLTGNVTIKNSGAHLSFTRDGYTAPMKVVIADIAANGIQALSGADKLLLSPSVFSSIKSKLAGDVSLKLAHPEPPESYHLNFALLREMEESTTGLVDATVVRYVNGSVADAVHVMSTKNGSVGDAISVAADLRVDSLSDTAATAADLRAIEEATTARVDARNITTITAGSVDDLTHILVTQRLKIHEYRDGIHLADDVNVTITDTGTERDTDMILDATTGVVTTSNLISGTYNNFSTGDRINTGLTFSSDCSQSLVDDDKLDWNWDVTTHTLSFETEPDSSANITVVLAGIIDITEAGGIFTLK